MNKIIFIGIALFITVNLSAQNWMTNYKNALHVAKQDNKNIVMVFSGSDWCAPCMKLEKYIFESEDFKVYSKEHWVLLQLKFPKKKANQLSKEDQAQNNDLAEKYNQDGYFPLVLVLDKNGKILGKTGYKKITPKEYIKDLKSFEI